MLELITTNFESVLFILLLPTTILTTLIAIVTIRAQWRSFLEAIGVQFWLTAIYRRLDGKELSARDIWESCESIRVLKTGLGSQVGYYAHGAEFEKMPVRIGGSFFVREYQMIIRVKDLTKGPTGPSWYPVEQQKVTEEKKS